MAGVLRIGVDGEQRAGKRKRAGNWSEDEIRCLIYVWDEFVDRLRAVKRNSQIYRAMMERMSEAGFNRSPDEVRVKINNLTAEYRKEKAKLQLGMGPSQWKFFEAVHHVIGNLPSHEESLMRASQQLAMMHNNTSCNHTASTCNNTMDDCSEQEASTSQPLDTNFHPHNQNVHNQQKKELTDAESDEDSEEDCVLPVPDTILRTNDGPSNHDDHSSIRSRALGCGFQTHRYRSSETVELLCRILEEQQRSNAVAETAERTAVALQQESVQLMREHLEMQRLSLNLEQRLIEAIERKMV